ncbi:uncharacterized protein LOC104888706 isoform X2 [Beta vulgaris subsp. vulgaris]|uniref:uncharacterized protein LOC104888706 isoform X2 n=2 Tax=Beta vulgaris subsp. vulgaris TaxID=3555 RepID=UPI002036B275|nr:uncharacterized protein LOC104888706 isoform X2 [Beta vulgaris subsp. vulgaris]
MSNMTVLPPTLRCAILPNSRFNSTSSFPKFIFSSLSTTPISTSFLSPRHSLSFSSMASPSKPSSQVVAAVNAVDDVEIFQKIQSHQEKAVRLPPVEEIRTVVANSTRGMLSTFSKKYDGYPSGSMVDFACDVDGTPILAVSSLAVHTQDLLANSQCSLLVAKDPDDRTDLVITLHGDAVAVTEEEREAVRTAYLAKHPTAFWVDFGDFQFLKIKLKVVRYVSGVATALLGSGEFSREEYTAAIVDPISQFSKPVASHMNKDHAEDTKLIVQHSTSVMVESAYIVDMDHLGFNVKASYMGKTYKLRIPFPRPAADRNAWKSPHL